MRVGRLITPLLAVSAALGLLANCGGNITGVKGSRFSKPLVLKVNSASAPTRQYAGVMQNSLRQAGIPAEIETVELNTLLDQVRSGQYQLTTSRWVGGNQDPIFLRDLFATGAPFNRWRYGNAELDRLLEEAVNTADRERARGIYTQAQEVISREIPIFPLWYSAQMVVARRGVADIRVDPSGNWNFLRRVRPEAAGRPFVVALESNPETLDQLRGTDASSERLRQLIYNTLVTKNEKLEYVGDLASGIEISEDGLAVTFTLRDGVRFHNGKPLTAQDVKYTLDTLLASDSRKATPFFEGSRENRQSIVEGVDARDARTVVIRLRKPWLQLMANLTPIGIIPQGSAGAQAGNPVGSGPFRFTRYDESQQMVDLSSNENYWEGAPSIRNLRVRVILDANTLQAELRSGGIDLANVANLSPDAFRSLGQDQSLRVEQFPGTNVVYLGFNTETPPLNDARVRQAIAYAIDREAIVRDLLLGQARVAHSIVPEESWAFAPGQKYTFDPEKARQLLDEAGFREQ